MVMGGGRHSIYLFRHLFFLHPYLLFYEVQTKDIDLTVWEVLY